jgi:AraC-like DNA-binding protein
MENGNDPPLAEGRNTPASDLGAPGLAELAGAHLRLIHCWWWSFGPAWTMAERTIPNGLLYLPLSSRLEFGVDTRSAPAAAGEVAVLPAGRPQWARYAPGAERRFHGWAIHLHLHDGAGRDLLARLGGPVLAVPEWEGWRVRLRRAVGAFNHGGEDGAAYAAATVRALLVELAAAHGGLRPAPAVDARLERPLALARADLRGELTVEDLARAAGVTSRRLRDLFQAATGMAPKDWLLRNRLGEAARLLRAEPRRTVKDIARALGFSSDHHFHASFRRVHGLTPSAWRSLPAGG